MVYSWKTFFYRLIIDPLVKSIRISLMSFVKPGDRVIEIACDTGVLSLAMAHKAGHVTGIDLSEEMIANARRLAVSRKIGNIRFELLDASRLSGIPDNSFDKAVTSLSMHQFDRDVALKVISEMRRIAQRIIIADYNSPMHKGPARSLAEAIEWMAGGDHYRNFRYYMKNNGIAGLAKEAGLRVIDVRITGKGVFTIAELAV